MGSGQCRNAVGNTIGPNRINQTVGIKPASADDIRQFIEPFLEIRIFAQCGYLP